MRQVTLLVALLVSFSQFSVSLQRFVLVDIPLNEVLVADYSHYFLEVRKNLL